MPVPRSYATSGTWWSSVHPYDVLEAEPEIVSGYYVDYGGVAFMVIYSERLCLSMTLSITIVNMD